jgi:hypothetical protein
MSRQVTALFRNRAEAEAVRARLTGIGIDPARINILDENIQSGEDGAPQLGVFDRLAQLILPEGAAGRFRLTADVDPEQLEEAGRIVEAGASGGALQAPRELREQTFIFRETAEQLVVEKEMAVREEIVMHRTAQERVETLHDTVRRTEVEVEWFGLDEPASSENRGTAGS